jgi:hypothetical protein
LVVSNAVVRKQLFVKIKMSGFLCRIEHHRILTDKDFIFTDKEKLDKEIEKTIQQVELTYKLGIPLMPLNTGSWDTSKSFDDLMANKGIKTNREGSSGKKTSDG